VTARRQDSAPPDENRIEVALALQPIGSDSGRAHVPRPGDRRVSPTDDVHALSLGDLSRRLGSVTLNSRAGGSERHRSWHVPGCGAGGVGSGGGVDVDRCDHRASLDATSTGLRSDRPGSLPV